MTRVAVNGRIGYGRVSSSKDHRSSMRELVAMTEACQVLPALFDSSEKSEVAA